MKPNSINVGQAVRFARDENGTTLVELAVVIPVFFFVFLGLVDFGRMSGEYVMAEKAVQLAARTAAVRPPACAGVPTTNVRGTVPPNTTPPRFGTLCSAGATVCANPGTISCTAVAGNPTVDEIWAAIRPILPVGAIRSNLKFSYAFNSNVGFLGGPYTPSVTVEIQNLNFQFATPLGGLAALSGSAASDVPSAAIPFPRMSVSLPGEDLALGNDG